MKITRDQSLVEFVPETDEETKMLGELWDVVVDCVKFNKKLVPVGEYVPQKENKAQFTIED